MQVQKRDQTNGNWITVKEEQRKILGKTPKSFLFFHWEELVWEDKANPAIRAVEFAKSLLQHGVEIRVVEGWADQMGWGTTTVWQNGQWLVPAGTV